MSGHKRKRSFCINYIHVFNYFFVAIKDKGLTCYGENGDFNRGRDIDTVLVSKTSRIQKQTDIDIEGKGDIHTYDLLSVDVKNRGGDKENVWISTNKTIEKVKMSA